MAGENQGTPPPQESPGPFSELNVPKANELTVDEAIAALRSSRPKGAGYSPERRELLAKINQESGKGYESLHLRGPVKIAKGESPALVYNFANHDAFYYLFDIPILSRASELTYYVGVRNPGQKDSNPIEAHLKPAWLIRDPNNNTFIISEGLGRSLGVQNGQDIVITQTYLKPEDINLDKI